MATAPTAGYPQTVQNPPMGTFEMGTSKQQEPFENQEALLNNRAPSDPPAYEM